MKQKTTIVEHFNVSLLYFETIFARFRLIQHTKILTKDDETLCLRILRVMQQTLEIDTDFEEKVCIASVSVLLIYDTFVEDVSLITLLISTLYHSIDLIVLSYIHLELLLVST